MEKIAVRNSINNILDYIEDNIKENIMLDNIAEYAYISKFHLHRLFSAMTDKTLMKYIRQRKLSCSINLLLNTDLKIIDIANEFSFGSEQSYIRAFKNEFGITPSKYRRSKRAIEITERSDLYEFDEIANGVILAPVFIAKPSIKLVGVKNVMSFDSDVVKKEVPHKQGNSFYYERSSEIKNIIDINVYYGLSHVRLDDYGGCSYMSALQVKEIEDIPKGMESITIPPNRYAVFKYIDFKHPRHVTFSDLNDLWKFISNRWFKNSYHKRLYYHFELIDGNIASEDYCEIDLYVPIKD